MYKCKECGQEYNVKPEYCDCGNDEFETVVTETFAEQKLNKVNQAFQQNSENSSKEQVCKVLKQEQAQNINNDNLAQKKEHQKIVKIAHPFDIISFVIFCFCLALSVFVIFFAWNPIEEDLQKTEQIKPYETKVIPSIDSFWNNTPIKIKENTVTKKDEKLQIDNVANNVTQTLIPVKTTELKKNSVPLLNNNKVQPQKTNTTNKKIATKQSSAVSNKVNTATAKTKDEAAKKQAEIDKERKDAEEALLKKLQEEQAKKNAEEKAKQAAIANKEYSNYKAQLRNTIGRKVDFTRVIGDGDCTVSFKIDSNGKLINRSFTKQSTNNTLNDAVYQAIMSTPYFNPPPSAYKNETLNLNIKFNNGNFEISLF